MAAGPFRPNNELQTRARAAPARFAPRRRGSPCGIRILISSVSRIVTTSRKEALVPHVAAVACTGAILFFLPACCCTCRRRAKPRNTTTRCRCISCRGRKKRLRFRRNRRGKPSVNRTLPQHQHRLHVRRRYLRVPRRRRGRWLLPLRRPATRCRPSCIPATGACTWRRPTRWRRPAARCRRA